MQRFGFHLGGRGGLGQHDIDNIRVGHGACYQKEQHQKEHDIVH